MKQLLLLFPLLLFSFNEENINDNNNSDLEVETHDSFLSDVEYGRMLYISPRGISCAKCHGKSGQGGQHLVTYYDKKRNPKILRGVNITTYSLEDLEASLKNEYKEHNRTKRHTIMPMYYLTKEEVHALYSYLKTNRKEREK